MDVVERLWATGDIDGTLREVDKILTTPQKDNKIINEALLLSAYIHFQCGKLHQSKELLHQVQFPTFDVHQWIVENNDLVIKYLEDKGKEKQINVSVIQNLASLLEKIQGLPCHDVALLEICVSFNFGLAVLATNAKEGTSIPGGYDMSQQKIQLTIDRVLGIGLNIIEQGTIGGSSMMDKLTYFCEGGGSDKNPVLDEVLFSLSWLCWLLSLFWLMDDYKVGGARELIQLVIKLNKLKSHISNLRQSGFLFSVMRDGINQENTNEGTLPAACNLVLCYGSFLNHDKNEALKQCNICLNINPQFLPALLIKGLILYENGSYCDVVQPLQQVLTLSQDKGYKATALNMLGCVCAKLGKPHTALIKFKNSFSSCKSHIEALYNVGLVYHEMNNYDLEISLWRYLSKILSQSNSSNISSPKEQINVTFIAGIATRILDRVISNDHLLITTDVYCIQNTSPYNSQLNRHVVLYKIANTCFQQKRYGEAAESSIELLALLDDKPVDVQKVSLPSLLVLFHDVAVALSQSGRHEDTITICDKVLFQRPALVSSELTKPTAKRSQENDIESWIETKSLVGIMLCKAEALIQLERPVDELYQRILDVLNKEFRKLSNCDKNDNGSTEQDHKRQKTDIGSKGIHKLNAEAQRHVEYEKLKAVVFNKQGVLMKSLGRNGEALVAFEQSISCQPSCIKYHYDRASLLIDVGKIEEASQNWLEVRKLDQKGKENVDTIELSTDNQFTEAYLNNEDLSLYIAMDALALKNSCV